MVADFYYLIPFLFSFKFKATKLLKEEILHISHEL